MKDEDEVGWHCLAAVVDEDKHCDQKQSDVENYWQVYSCYAIFVEEGAEIRTLLDIVNADCMRQYYKKNAGNQKDLAPGQTPVKQNTWSYFKSNGSDDVGREEDNQKVADVIGDDESNVPQSSDSALFGGSGGAAQENKCDDVGSNDDDKHGVIGIAEILLVFVDVVRTDESFGGRWWKIVVVVAKNVTPVGDGLLKDGDLSVMKEG